MQSISIDLGRGSRIGFVQSGLDTISLDWDLELAKNGEGLSQLLPLGSLVALLPRQQSPVPSQNAIRR
jgi:hypothetical protein